jgi:Tol biopolymer transport system component
MLKRSILTVSVLVLSLALPVSGAAARHWPGTVVFSKVERSESSGAAVTKGGLFAARWMHVVQLTEDPRDSQPAFSPDGTKLVFVRDGDLYTTRADGSGLRALTGGPEIDSQPAFSPDGRSILFERSPAEGAPRQLFAIGSGGGRLHALAPSPADDHEASFSPDGRTIVFVHSTAAAAGGTSDDLYSVRPSGAGLTQLTHTARVDEFDPRYFAGGIVFSRGDSGPGAGSFADVFTMRRDGTGARKLIAGAGSAYVEDVSTDGRLLLLRRRAALWLKPLGPSPGSHRARDLAAAYEYNALTASFAPGGREVAIYISNGESDSITAVRVPDGGEATIVASEHGAEAGSAGVTIGPDFAWRPVPSAR